jgi:hypothetical protein
MYSRLMVTILASKAILLKTNGLKLDRTATAERIRSASYFYVFTLCYTFYTSIFSHLPRSIAMRSRLLLITALALLFSACATQPSQPAQNSLSGPTDVYSFQEGDNPNNHVKHTLFLIGNAASGPARYTAAAFVNGTRSSLSSSGGGTYSVAGNEITIRAGALNGKGVFLPGKQVDIDGKKFTFAMTMRL